MYNTNNNTNTSNKTNSNNATNNEQVDVNMKIRCKISNNNGRPRLVFFDLQESSITEAVEKQLNATATTAAAGNSGSSNNPSVTHAAQTLTPQMVKKGLGGNSTADLQASTPMSGNYSKK